MSYLVGAILIAIFLAFAMLMFLERLSALLALPLMAFSFLCVAVAADLLQPPVVRELRAGTPDRAGRAVWEWQEVPSRFALWRQVRGASAAGLTALADTYAKHVAQVAAAVDGGGTELRQRVEAALTEGRAADDQARAALRSAGETIGTLFSRPPHYAGPAATLRNQAAEIPWPAFEAGARAVLARDLSGAELAEALHPVLAPARAEAAQLAERYAARRESDWTAPRDALAYARESLFLLFRAGSLHLYATIIATVFGGMFAMYVKNLGVAERLVLWTAEFAGERPAVISFAVFLVTAVIFTSVGGLGTVIMLGAIILPILRSVGLGPVVAAGVFLIGIAMGGTLQPVSRRLWLDFYGLPAAELDRILWTMVALYFACGSAWILWGTRRALLSSFHAVALAPEAEPPAVLRVPARLMLAPLVPVALVYFGGVEELTAFTVSIAYMFLCVARRAGAVRVLARSLIEGAQAVMPPVLLMIGIGMLVVSLGTEAVQGYLRPLLLAAVPQTQAGYIVLFALAAPLALYRGPLNAWGMGLAVSAMLLTGGTLPAAAVLGTLLAAGMLQGVCDPTNTANVWIAGFQGITVNQILRHTLLPVWLAAAAAVVIFGLRYL